MVEDSSPAFAVLEISTICTIYEDRLWKAARRCPERRAQNNLRQRLPDWHHQRLPHAPQAGAEVTAGKDQMTKRMENLATKRLLGRNSHIPLLHSIMQPRHVRPYLVDHMNTDLDFSVGSIDEMLNGEGVDKVPDAWQAELAERIEEILARKGSTVLGRENCYKTYVHLLTVQYAEAEIRGKETELVVAFLKSIKEGKSEKETLLALKGDWESKLVPKYAKLTLRFQLSQ